MKSLFLFLALLAMTTSCEKRTTGFDPDKQVVSDDELAQIGLWDQFQEETQTKADYERMNAEEFVDAECEGRKNTAGIWVIKGSVTNLATEVHYEEVQLILSYYSEDHSLIGTEKFTLRENLAPGDQSGFYLKSDQFDEAHSMDVAVAKIKSSN